MGRKVNMPRPISIGATKSQKVIVAEWSRRRRDAAVGAGSASLGDSYPATPCFAISVPSERRTPASPTHPAFQAPAPGSWAERTLR